MRCATCGAVGGPGASWCPQCFLPYARAGSIPPPPAYPPPSYPPPGYPQAWPAELGLVVPQSAVETGDLHRICVVSGVPTTNMVRQRWSWAPAWTYFLGLLIRLLVADRVAGYLPIAPAVRRRHALTVGGAIFGFMTGFLMLLGGAADNQGIVALLGLALFIGSIVVMIRKGQLVKVKRAAPGFLAIRNASPEFARAFRSGRPAGQAPYTSTPAPFMRKSVIVLAVILALFALFSVAMQAIDRDPDSCQCGSSNGAVTTPLR